MSDERRGFALTDVVLSITVMSVLLIPSARILNRATEMIVRAEHLSHLTVVMESVTEKIRTNEWQAGTYSEDDCEIVISPAKSLDSRIEIVHITVKDREGTFGETKMFRRLSD